MTNDDYYPTYLEEILDRMPLKTLIAYIVFFVATVIVLGLGIYYEVPGDVAVATPVAIILLVTIFSDKKFIHIPPVIILLMIAVMYLSIISKVLISSQIVDFIGDALIGVTLGIVGIIIVYSLTKTMPGARTDNPELVSMFSLFFGISVYAFWLILQEYLLGKTNPLNDNMLELVCLIAGNFLVAILFYANKQMKLFEHTVNKFLETNYDTIGITEETASEDVLRIIGIGENDRVEFKSTLRTNLQTGERDKRMEKAVLKTIVAFLNTDGGTLLVGVADDGSVLNIDDEDFDNRDKLNLHVTNILSSQIGNEFLPYISFQVVDVNEGSVLKFDCNPCMKPVFHKDGTVETFYVRSGPSSIELGGMDLINYVNNRKYN